MQADVRIENEKIDLPADGKKRRFGRRNEKETEITGEELRMKTERELRAERRESEREGNNKIDSDARAGVEEGNGIRVLPVYTGEELDEFKANYPKVKGTLLPWKTKHRAAMNDRKQWPPIWKKKFKESPEYEAFHYFLLNRRSDDRYKLICKEIRSSRGYDITHVDQYIPQEFHEMHLFAKCMAVAACKYVTDQINERAKDHGESYVFDEVQKVVRWKFPSAHYWYTFTVRQERPTSGNIKTVQAFAYCRSQGKVLVFLKEWRFKP